MAARTVNYRALSEHRLLDPEPDLRASDPWDFVEWAGFNSRATRSYEDRRKLLHATVDHRLGRSNRVDRIVHANG